MREMTEGKRPKPKYLTLGEALGIQDEELAYLDSEAMQDAGDAYNQALINAMMHGLPLPDAADFVPDDNTGGY